MIATLLRCDDVGVKPYEMINLRKKNINALKFREFVKGTGDLLRPPF